jgi:hypothetical protein
LTMLPCTFQSICVCFLCNIQGFLLVKWRCEKNGDSPSQLKSQVS